MREEDRGCERERDKEEKAGKTQRERGGDYRRPWSVIIVVLNWC